MSKDFAKDLATFLANNIADHVERFTSGDWEGIPYIHTEGLAKLVSLIETFTSEYQKGNNDKRN